MATKITEDMRDEFERAYLDENLSQEQMAERFGVSRTTIKAMCSKWGIHKTEQQRLDRIKQTMIEKYGVSSPLQSKDFLEKSKKSYMDRTGYDCPAHNPSVVQKRKKTNMEKYGVENPMQSDAVKTKTSIGLRKLYSDPATKQKILEQRERTCEERTGYKYPCMNADVLAKLNKTFMEKYGCNPTYRHLPKQTVEILQSKELFCDFLEKNKQHNTRSLGKILQCSPATICRAIRRYDLQDQYDSAQSQPEEDVARFITSLGVDVVRNTRKIIEPQEIDIYCPDYKIAIEFNGYYWHSFSVLVSKGRDGKNYHYDKSMAAQKAGIRLIHIYENEWDDPIKREIIKSVLRICFGKVENRIYARNCEVRKITNAEARPFNEVNHLQGHRNAQITYGLFHDGKLVQLMSFSKHKKYGWEIIRGCPGSNNIVVGGVSKLFKHFIAENNPESVFSYCDFNKFDGVGYEQLGMEFIGYTGPDMKWIIDGEVVNRKPSKHKYYKSIAEDQLFGAGSKKYLWKKEIQ